MLKVIPFSLAAKVRAAVAAGWRSALLIGVVLVVVLPLGVAAASGAGHGSLDRGFGIGGRVRTVIGSDAFAEALAIQKDGRLVAAGGSDSHFALARYNSDGSLDRSFGKGGIVTVSMGPYCCAAAYAVVIQPDGKVVAAGESSNNAHHEADLLSTGVLVRFDADGSLDRGFGNGGRVTVPAAFVRALVLQPDGKLVVAGDDFMLVRYTASGRLDRTFGSNGKAMAPIRSGGGSFGAWALALQPDGKLVQAGYSLSGFTLALHNSDGSLDRGFGKGGIVTTAFGKWNAEARALGVQADGKLVAAGDGQGDPHGTEVVFELARYNRNGTLDRSFGTGGRVTTAIGSSSAAASALVIQPDGKLAAAGNSGPSDLFTLVRYKPNGVLDTSFGSRGIVVTAGPGSAGSGAYALAIQMDHKLVAAGSVGMNRHSRFALVRYNG
jgi:uncharacterized delta-60 repeat protein